MDTGRMISIEDVFHDGDTGTAEPLRHTAAVSARKAQQSGKSEGAFLTISEAAESLNVPQHVLRFWETKFTQIKPLKRGGGRRYYRPEDVALLQRIHALLYTEGYTIRGVQKLLKGQGRQQAAMAMPAHAPESRPASAHRGSESMTPSAGEVLAALLPQATPAPQTPAAPATEFSPSAPRAGLTSHQRRLMEGLLEDLRTLRTLIAAAEGGSNARAAS